MSTSPMIHRESRWLFLSFLIHGLVLLALWFTPVRQMVLGGSAEKPKPESRLTERRIEQIIEQVRESAEDEAREMIQQLQRTEEMVRENLEQSVEQYQQEAAELSTEAPERAMDQLTSVRDAQQQALADAQAALDQLQRAATETEEQKAREDRKEARASQQKVNESQATALDAQKAVDREMAFMDDTFKDVKDAVADARDAQQAAAEAQDEARAKTKEVLNLENSLPKTADQLQRAEENAKLNQNRVESAKEDLQKRTEALQESEEQVTKAETNGTADAKAKSKTQLERNQKRMEDAKKRVEDYSRRAEASLKSADETRQKLAEDQKRLEERKEELVDAQQKALKSQQDAIAHQQNMEQKLTQAVQNKMTAGTAPVPEETKAVLNPPDPATLEQKNLAELYAEAVATEQRVAELYRQQKATDAATLTQTPLTESLANTQSVTTDRPELNTEILTKPVGTLEDGQAHREELDKMKTEMMDIRATVQRLGALSSSGESAGTGFSVSTMISTASTGEAGEGSSASTLASQLELLAAENSTTAYQDLSQLMRAAMGIGQGSMQGGAPSGSGTSAPEPRNVPPAQRIGARPTGQGNPGWVYLNNWYILGPFDNPNRRHLDTHFPPESIIDLDAVYRDEDGRQLVWNYQNNPRVRLVPRNDQPYAIFYGYTEVWCETDMDRVIAIGSDDYSQVWVNGIQVWASGKQQKAWKPDEGLRKVYFRAGINRILMRLENGQYGSSMSVMINLEP